MKDRKTETMGRQKQSEPGSNASSQQQLFGQASRIGLNSSPEAADALRVVELIEDVSRKLERSQRFLTLSFSEFELLELEEILKAGANPHVEFTPDLTAMAVRAAEASRQACTNALALIASRIQNIHDSRKRSEEWAKNQQGSSDQ